MNIFIRFVEIPNKQKISNPNSTLFLLINGLYGTNKNEGVIIKEKKRHKSMDVM